MNGCEYNRNNDDEILTDDKRISTNAYLRIGISTGMKKMRFQHKMSNLFLFVLMTRKEPISSLNSIFLVNLSPCMHI